jgi:hypothetical protein
MQKFIIPQHTLSMKNKGVDRLLPTGVEPFFWRLFPVVGLEMERGTEIAEDRSMWFCGNNATMKIVILPRRYCTVFKSLFIMYFIK